MVFETLRGILCENLSVDENEITLESTFESLGADSLDLVEIIMQVEDEFNITVDEADTDALTTVGAVVDYINSHS